MENAQNKKGFQYTRQPNRLLQLGGQSLIFGSILTALPYAATPGTAISVWNLTPLFLVMIFVGLLLSSLRSKLCISPDGTELVETRTLLGMPLTEKRSKMEFNTVVIERDWDVNEPQADVQYIVKLVGSQTIFYIDEVPYLSQADQLAEDLAKALNLSIVKEGYFPARYVQK